MSTLRKRKTVPRTVPAFDWIPSRRMEVAPSSASAALREKKAAGSIAVMVNPAAAAPKRLVVRPILGPPEGLDVTDVVVRALAHELWQRHGGNATVNWLEAERLVRELAARG